MRSMRSGRPERDLEEGPQSQDRLVESGNADAARGRIRDHPNFVKTGTRARAVLQAVGVALRSLVQITLNSSAPTSLGRSTSAAQRLRWDRSSGRLN
jgi:hypothetical protein